MKFFFCVVFGLFVVASVFAQDIKPFSEAKGYGVNAAIYDFDKWNFLIGDAAFEIQKAGKVIKKDAKGRTANLRIKLDVDEELNRVVYFTEYKGDLILLCESNVFDGGSGFLMRIDQISLKSKWKTNIPAFNIARGLIENNFAYVAAIGFIGKIDLDTGKYLWKHDDLYYKYDKTGAFNIFLTPQIKDDFVIFKEEDTLMSGFDHQIKVSKTSGKIIEVLLK